MNYKEFKSFRKEFLSQAIEVSDQKSIEYTISNDSKLYNFHNVAERLGITPQQAMMVYMLKHMDALCNDAKTGKTFSDETARNRCIDLANYATLYAALTHTEGQNETYNTKPDRDANGDIERHGPNGAKPDKWNQLKRSEKT
jgi:hypothetical protein